jgi:hypothetical protein
MEFNIDRLLYLPIFWIEKQHPHRPGQGRFNSELTKQHGKPIITETCGAIIDFEGRDP